jgi:mono/diheme cytochrome c family protein
MRRILTALILAGALVALAGIWITRPKTVDPDRFAALQGDPAVGERLFWAAGCASCHAAPESEDKLVLAGGRRFATPFGTFVAPNISSDSEHGIGGWDLADFASALLEGTSPEGSHYYPAFPYATYTRMTDQDVAHLYAFVRALPADPTPGQPHELGFPFNIRLALGGWKLLYLRRDWVADAASPEIESGRYLVEALGHCGECHTPRTALGGPDYGRWLGGAPNPTGKGTIPPLTPDKLTWSEIDIAAYLKTGFTPDFDTAGGEMVEVVRNMARLSDEDRAAIAAYLKALPGG